jgi:hypothetical protein
MYTVSDITSHYPELNETTLVYLPETPTTATKEGHSVYHSESTRPLAVSKSDNNIITSACRLTWETLAADRRHPHERGLATQAFHVRQYS